ncbi:MAG: radical SAM protein [Deltaproteobacteria bacterium]|nr:radical SAM protein [Deltaproteobacteria bacterium]
MTYLKEILPKIIRYRLSRRGLVNPGSPINLTFSVTNQCQSKCKTCHIWDLYNKHPEKRKEELTISEIDKIFMSMGHIYIFNISGGEPFLRDDITQIIEAACKYLTPGIIHIPTNAIAVNRIEKKTKDILNLLKAKYPHVRLTVKPSMDHIEEKHDAIRGVPGNFKKVMDVFHKLKKLQLKFPQLHVELGTVISKWNVRDIKEISDYIIKLGMDSYRNEIAEQRSEMYNQDHNITPSARDYEQAIEYFVSNIKTNMKNRSLFNQITNAFRLVYYKLAIQILKTNEQVIPCYAGISNAHLSAYGDIWACCTLGYDKNMGNLREYNYNFPELWGSDVAKNIRKYIKNKNCACPLANQAYSNILLNTPSLFNVLREILITR